MLIQRNVSLQPLNSFGIMARAAHLLAVRGEADVRALLADAKLAAQPRFVLGGGSNIVLTGDVKGVVLKVEVPGRRVVAQTDRHALVEAGAGENWHDFVAWTLDQGLPGLENLALIPGTVGASPVQNIGAYGLELQDRFHELDAIDLHTGELFTLSATQCGFGYRDSVFKHIAAQEGGFGLAGRALILRVRFALPRAWQPVLGYLDLERRMAEEGVRRPSARQIFDWIVAIRRAKLPDPAVIGNAGSFFKNPVVPVAQAEALAARFPALPVFAARAPGQRKLSAGWLIENLGLRGYRDGDAGVAESHALVLVNHGEATGAQIWQLAQFIRERVAGAYGVTLEPEPVIV